ncbi:hypothetical protein pb186bvf_017984 [Paramecium bursaria]
MLQWFKVNLIISSIISRLCFKGSFLQFFYLSLCQIYKIKHTNLQQKNYQAQLVEEFKNIIIIIIFQDKVQSQFLQKTNKQMR